MKLAQPLGTHGGNCYEKVANCVQWANGSTIEPKLESFFSVASMIADHRTRNLILVYLHFPSIRLKKKAEILVTLDSRT